MLIPHPPGFKLYTRPSPLLEPWAPIYWRELQDRVVLGIRVRTPHLNSRGTVHGGLYAALADQALGLTCAQRLRDEGYELENLWTSSLTVDYLGNTRLDQWLVFDTVFSHVGKTLCQAELNITADGDTVARARGSFRVILAKPLAHASSSS